MKRRCGVCGAFISEKNPFYRIYEGCSNEIVIFCRKCGAVLTLVLLLEDK